MRNRFVTKIISILMCISLLLCLSGCNLAQDIKENFENRISLVDDVSVQELTRLLISSINDSSKTSDVYSSINDYQMNNLSYSYFSEYLDILRNNSRQDNNGRVQSFRMMNNQECVSIVGSNIAYRYGSLVGAELLYEEKATYPVYIFFVIDDKGTPYISSDWVRSYIDTYNYGNHYFTLLNEENTDGVRALISPSLTDPAYNDEAIASKVQALCDFYRLRVMSNIGAYEIVHIFPGSMSVRIPETLAADGTSFEEHIVNFSYNSNGNYIIDDEIIMASDNNLVYLYSGENRLLRIGNSYSYNDLVSSMGEPISTTYYENNNSLIAMYLGVIIRFEDISFDGDLWTGSISSIRVYGNSTYTVGYNAYLGMTKSALLVAYPFIDSTDYTLQIETSTGIYNVEFEFNEDDVLGMIRITL